MMKASIRPRFIVALAVAGLFLSGGAARAADYTVKIGADTQSGQDTSSLICWFDHPCHGELKGLRLQVDIDVHRAMTRIARVRLHGRPPGCCTFEHGRDETVIDLRGVALHQEPIFKGVKAREGVMIENVCAGALYLRFHLLSPDWDDRRSSERSI